MQGAKDQVAGGGRLHGKRNRLQVPHFTDQDDIRVLPQRTAKRVGKRLCVLPHLPVVHHAAVALVDELDRVLDGENVVFPGAVGHIDDGRQGGRFTASGRARHHHKPPGKSGELGDDRRQTELFRRENRAGDLAENRRHAVFLHEKIGPVTGQVRNFVTEIDVTGFLEFLDLVLRGDLVEHRLEFVVFEHLIFDPLQLSPDAQDRLLSGDQVEVGRALVVHQLEKGIDFGHG